MKSRISIGTDCIISPSAIIEDGVLIGCRAIMEADGITVRANARIDSGSIIGENVTIGLGAWIRAGSVVLESVPPNAIVQGNPAEVVGYRSESVYSNDQASKLIDIHCLTHIQQRPARVALDVGHCALYLMRSIADPRGSLSVGEVPDELPFAPKRYFVVYDVPSLELRGEHAHKECEQFLICLNGSCRLLLDDGCRRCEVILDRPDMGVYMSAMTWGTQYRYSNDAVLLVFASLPYDNNDYIREYQAFIAATTSQP